MPAPDLLDVLLAGGAVEHVDRWRTEGDRVVVLCRSGVRSERAAAYLLDEGVARVESLAGGILAWQDTHG